MVERLAGARTARGHGPHVPRPRAQPAPPLLAVAARRRAAARRSSIRSSRSSCRSSAALPGHYRFTPGQGPRRRDRVGEESATRRRTTYEAAVTGAPGTPGREPPIPVDLFVRTFAGYERAKTRAGRIDFDDLLVETVDLLENDAEAAETVRARKRWFSVDEYQDTNPLQQRLLELWLGDRPDVCVVGDEDQTIYTFTGATQRVPDRVRRAASGRPGRRPERQLPLDARRSSSSPTACSPRPGGPSTSRRRGRPAPSRPIVAPQHRGRPSWRRSSPGSASGSRTAPRRVEIAVLVRMNAQLEPIEAALTRAGIAVPGPRHPLLRPARGPRRDRPRASRGRGRVADRDRAGAARRGPRRCGRRSSATTRTDDVGHAGDEARERTAALDTLLDILVDAARRRTAGSMRPAYLAELDRRRAGGARGLGRRRQPPHVPPGEGPRVGCGRAADARGGLAADPPGVRRRRAARRGAAAALRRASPGRGCISLISWAAERETRGRTTRRQPSRFLADLRPRPAQRVVAAPGPVRGGTAAAAVSPCRGLGRRRPRRRRPADGRAPCLAHGPCPRGWRARLHRLPRPDPRRDRRDQPVVARPACAASRASARPSSRPTATRSSRSSARPGSRTMWA